MRLREKVSIITGAGSGMGRVAALRFAYEGSRILVRRQQRRRCDGDRPTGPGRRWRGNSGNCRRVVSRPTRRPWSIWHPEVRPSRRPLYNNAGSSRGRPLRRDTPVENLGSGHAVTSAASYLACKVRIPC